MTRYRITAVRSGRSAVLTPRPGATAAATSISKIVLKSPRAGRGRLRVGRTLTVRLRPVAKGRSKRPRR